jgi:hypothetical protein
MPFPKIPTPETQLHLLQNNQSIFLFPFSCKFSDVDLPSVFLDYSQLLRYFGS